MRSICLRLSLGRIFDPARFDPCLAMCPKILHRAFKGKKKTIAEFRSWRIELCDSIFELTGDIAPAEL